MPSCSTATNKRGVKITFTEENHEYSSIINGNKIIYTSGTTFINNFFPKFDPTGEITERCAKREGISVYEMKKRWGDKANKSCIYGTKIHECMEDRLQGHPLRNKPSDDREKVVFQVTEELSTKILPKVEIIGIEKIIFDERLKIAGTIDFLMKSKKDGKIWICDWKTNEKIEVENKYNNFGLEPINHIPAISFHEYAMQLNLYEYLLKYGGYIDEDCEVGKILFHITEKGYKNYVLPDYQKEIKDMIDYYQGKGI